MEVNCDHVIRAHKLCTDLNNIMMLIHSGHDVERILHEIVEESSKALGCESARIAVREGENWVIRYVGGLPDDLIGRSFTDKDLPHAAIAMLTKKPVAIDDAFEDDRTNTEMMKTLGLRSILVLPILDEGTVTATLLLGYHSVGASLTAAEIDYAEKISTGVAIALQNVRLFHEKEEAEKLGDALNRIDTLMYSMRDYDATMQRMLELATEAIGAETALIFLREGRRWVVRYVYKLSEELIGRSFSNSEVLHTAITAETKRSLVVADALNSLDVDINFINMLGIRSLLDFPLIVQGEVIGDLTFHYHSAAVPFKESHIEFVRKLQNAITLALANARLLTAAKQNESRMQEAEQLGKFGYFSYDCGTNKITCSEGLCTILGRDPVHGELTPEEFFELYSIVPGFDELKEIAEKEDAQEFDAVVKRGGNSIHVSIALRSLKDDDGAVSEVFGTIQDVTERKLAGEELREKERMLIQQNRMAAMGEMLGNIAHHWRQPLNVLGLKVQEIGLTYELGGFSKELLDKNIAEAMKVVLHMSQIIDDFRSFTLPEKEKSLFTVNEVIAKAGALIEDNFSELRIMMEVDTSGDQQVKGYPNEYIQVLLNLLMNARDAFLERGTKGARITVHSSMENGRSVVTVTDNAGGIDESILDRLFDPYFTTKEPGKGTGLGLFMSKTIIEKYMGGRLTVRNVEGGAEFRIEV